MSPEAQQLIDEWKEYNEQRFNKLVALIQTEAVSDILTKLQGKPTEVFITNEEDMPAKAEVEGLKNPSRLQELEARRQARKQNKEVQKPKVYANPADDPNYGMMGSDAASTGEYKE